MKNTIGQLDNTRNNNFDLIRFVAASLVICSHSYLVLGAFEEEPFKKWVGFYNLGAISVCVFFVISGYLITKSLLRQDSLSGFIWARALRIFPALCIAVLFCVLIIGPLCTSVTLAEYFSQANTYTFLWGNATLLKPTPFLTGVFEKNPYPQYVNSPLWTLRAELFMYLVVFFGGVVALAFKGNYAKIGKSAALIVGVSLYLLGMQLTKNYLLHQALQWIMFFVMGAGIYALRNKIKVDLPYAILAWVTMVLFIVFKIPGFKFVFILTIAYSIFVFAYHPTLLIRGFNKYGDFSYGLYIYAFPIQQALTLKVPGLSPLSHFAISYALTFVLAVFSWHYVEKRALQLKNIDWTVKTPMFKRALKKQVEHV